MSQIPPGNPRELGREGFELSHGLDRKEPVQSYVVHLMLPNWDEMTVAAPKSGIEEYGTIVADSGIFIQFSERSAQRPDTKPAINPGEQIMGLWKRNLSSNGSATSVIDHGCLAEGRLNFVGVLAFNGQFRGEVLSSDTILVGEKAEVDAAVEAGVAVISGQVKGNITARERVELRGTARIYGNVVAPVLIIEEGVVIDGQCKTILEKDSEPDGYK